MYVDIRKKEDKKYLKKTLAPVNILIFSHYSTNVSLHNFIKEIEKGILAPPPAIRKCIL